MLMMMKAKDGNEEGKGKQKQGFLVPCSCEARRKEPPAPCLGGQRRFDVISFDLIAERERQRERETTWAYRLGAE